MAKVEDVKWIIEEGVWSKREENDIIDALKILNLKYKKVSKVELLTYPYRIFPKNSCVVFSGSLITSSFVRNLSFFPGLYYTKDNFDCHNYYPALSKLLLNKDYYFLPFGSLKNLEEVIFKDREEVFIRPNSGSKTFTGKVVSKKSFGEDLDKFELESFEGIKPNSLVLISNAKEIIREWRFFVVDEKIIDGCLYISTLLSDTDKNKHEEVYLYAKEKAKEAIKFIKPDSCFTIDICQTSSGLNKPLDDLSLFVLEINAFSTSGMYDCNCGRIIQKVSEQALFEYYKYQKETL